MFLNRIWVILVTLLAGVGITLALVAPRPAVQKLEQLEAQRLDRAQYAAQQMLRADAHLWIDTASKLGRDAILSESLDAASRGAGEVGVVHKTVQDRLRVLLPDLQRLGLLGVVATDARGRVVARLGSEEAEFKDSVGGVPVVAEALRGYMADDTTTLGGTLVRTAAAPVVPKARDRIVGALLVMAETGPRLAELWKKNLGVEIALLVRGRVVASTLSEALLTNLPDKIAERAPEIAEAERTRAIPLQAGSDLLLAVAAPFKGSAARQDAQYALIGKQPASADLASLITNTSKDDLKWGRFPWLIVGGGTFLLLLLGLGLQRLEISGPTARLRTEVARLARGESSKIDDRGYGGRLGSIARDINAALERYTHASQPAPALHGRDIGAILSGSSQEAVRVSASMQASLKSLGAPPPPAFATPSDDHFLPPPASVFGAPPPANRITPPAPAQAARPSAGRPAAPPAARPAATPPAGTAASVAGSARAASALAASDTDTPIKAPPFQPFPVEQEETTAVGDISAAEDEMHFHGVFHDYVATRKNCGEPTDSLTFDKFKLKLLANKQQLVAKHACRTVRFAVYVKDGKASIKATPVK